MSYARFGAGDSDVYVYLDVNGYLRCCACSIGDSEVFRTTADLLEHLDTHKRLGHVVRDDTIARLKEDAARNDEWIATHPHEDGVEALDELERRLGKDSGK